MASHKANPNALRALPARPIERVTDPLRRFLHIEAASGVLLLLAAAAAIVMANSPLADAYHAFAKTRVVIGAGSLTLDYPLWYWVNDGLMAVFFFVVGLEIKRELTHGQLADPRSAALPVIAAIGGAALPALIFVLTLGDAPGSRGWAVPMATDIAFVVGALALFGERVPRGLKVFVLSLAIVDDLIAVLVIAFFYTDGLSGPWLGAAAFGLAVVAVMSRLNVRSIGVYVFVGAAIWLFTLKGGIHPTIAGVLLGLMTPATAWLSRKSAAQHIADCAATLTEHTDGEGYDDDDVSRDALERAVTAGREGLSPLGRLEHALHPWVAFGIMPLFAFVNAGVPFEGASMTSGVGLAVAISLVLGKPVGIGLASLLAVRLGWARLPEASGWPLLLAAGVLGGVGFTAAPPPSRDTAGAE